MLKKIVSGAVLACATLVAFAADSGETTVREAFHSLLPNAKIDRIVKSEVPGFYEVVVGGQIVYISADGKYLMQGNLYDVPGKKSLTEARLAGIRSEALRSLPASKMMTFSPEHPKHTVTVFTDVDCPYCRQFHKQIADFNKLGIAVRYVLFPLPMHKGADKKAETVWCSDDRNATYTSAMAGKWDKPPTAAPKTPAADNAKTEETLAYTPLTCSNPIDELTTLGREMGVDGTPAIFTADGDHVGGYMAPEQLLQRLDQLAQRGGPVAAK